MTGKTLKELNVQVGDVVQSTLTRRKYVITDLDIRCSIDMPIWQIISSARKYTAWQFTPAPENAETHTMPDGAVAWRVEVKPVVKEVMQKIGLHTGHTVVVKFNKIDGVPDCASVKMELLS